MSLRDYDRYINNEILQASTRPQVKKTYSVNAMATAVNAAFGLSLYPSDIEEICGWKHSWVQAGNVGNEELEKGLEKVFRYHYLTGRISRYKETIETGELNIERAWIRIKRMIRAKDSALIYHMAGHYAVIAGYYEEPWDVSSKNSSKFEDRKDWVVFAEHSRERSSQPIWCMTWKEVRCDIRDNPHHMIFRVVNTLTSDV